MLTQRRTANRSVGVLGSVRGVLALGIWKVQVVADPYHQGDAVLPPEAFCTGEPRLLEPAELLLHGPGHVGSAARAGECGLRVPRRPGCQSAQRRASQAHVVEVQEEPAM